MVHILGAGQPRNVREFPVNFPGAQRLALGTNYRSRPAVVNSFEAFAKTMSVGDASNFGGWQAHRDDQSGTVTIDVAENLDGEIATLAQHIQCLHDEGIPFLDQAVLCGSHTNLGRIATRLEAEQIPVLYIGDLFEREEVRDLLALIAFTCEAGGAGLIRVGQFPEYRISSEDAVQFLQYVRSQEVRFPDFLYLVDEIDGLSEEGRAGLTLLQENLTGVGYSMTAWTMLTQYLFNNSELFRRILNDSSVSGLQRQLAIHQFLAFIYAYRTPPEGLSIDPKRWFLETVRRLQMLRETKQLRVAPEGAEAIDAVRLLTLHASKGLEYGAVYLPVLGRGKFPFPRQGQRCPPPAGMLPEEMDQWQDAEEACLFFVALSRARDQLFLSRATSYGKQGSNHLLFLDALRELLPPGYDAEAKRPLVAATPNEGVAAENDAQYHANDLGTYLRCPRRYLYRHIFDLASNSQDTAYGQMHASVREVLSWHHKSLEQGNELTRSEIEQRFEAVWEELGPQDHAFEDMYREYGASMLQVAVEMRSPDDHYHEPQTWSVEHPAGTILFKPDQVITKPDGQKIVRRVTTGKIKEDENIDALYSVGATQALGDDVTVDVQSLSSNETLPIAMSTRKLETRVSRYGRAIKSIQESEFGPNPSPWCPSCPYYFICPSPQEAF
ncbi:MAG: ATP-dependent helicase [Chloroflexi bacterium]|nr:MAG: ATP-dependent helicase [Chloroflexota bacterium]